MINDTFYKFDQLGNALPYYGNTIISYLNDDRWDIFSAALEFQCELKKTSYANKMAFLPPESFHMTILNLCRVIDKSTAYWPKMISQDVKFSYVDCELKDIVDKIPKPENVMMEVERCEKLNIILRPADIESEKKLKNYRDIIAEKTTIRHSWHDTFEFHLTLDYLMTPLSNDEEAKNKILCDEYSRKIKKEVKPFMISEPEFVIFNDMMSYETDLRKRGNIY